MHKRRVKQMQPLITQSIKIQLIAAVHCSALQCNTAKPLHPQHGFKPTCAKRKMGLCIYMYIVLKIISQHIIQQIIIGKIFMNRKSESAWFDKGLSGNNTCMYCMVVIWLFDIATFHGGKLTAVSKGTNHCKEDRLSSTKHCNEAKRKRNVIFFQC